MIRARAGGFNMLLISYRSVAGWFRVWSVCVKAQLRVQSSRHSDTPPHPHTPFACLTFFFVHHWLSVWGWEGPLGRVRGFNDKCEPGQEVDPTRANSVKIRTFVVKALIMSRSRLN